MQKEITIKLNITFPDYNELKTAIKACKQKWEKNEYKYGSEVTYSHVLVNYPGSYFRIYASDDTCFQPTFDEMHGGHLYSDKKFELTKKGYQELVKYAMERIRSSVKCW